MARNNGSTGAKNSGDEWGPEAEGKWHEKKDGDVIVGTLDRWMTEDGKFGERTIAYITREDGESIRLSLPASKSSTFDGRDGQRVRIAITGEGVKTRYSIKFAKGSAKGSAPTKSDTTPF